MSIDKTIGFIGAGNMAEALIRGLLRGGDFASAQIAASGPREERMSELRDQYGIYATTDNKVPAASEIVVLSVKPQIFARVLDEVASTISPETGHWHQTWVDDSGGYLDFLGGLRDGEMILEREATCDGATFRQRMLWTDIGPDSLEWRWQRSIDVGAPWETVWAVSYRRAGGA